jgi:ABC-type lipoprotein release transport system permease subunit
VNFSRSWVRLAQFKGVLANTPSLAVDAMREGDYYRQQSQAFSTLLLILGGTVGGGIAWLMFNGHAVSTNGGGLTQLSIPLAVDVSLIGFGILWACIIGMVGAAFPAIRAARASLASALRGI